jgi:hypothetical protein
MKYAEFIKRMQDRVSRLPKAEQVALLWQVYGKNEEYSKLAELDRAALNGKLGLAASSPSVAPSASPVSPDRLAQVATETVVRATVWESVAVRFRAFR